MRYRPSRPRGAALQQLGDPELVRESLLRFWMFLLGCYVDAEKFVLGEKK